MDLLLPWIPFANLKHQEKAMNKLVHEVDSATITLENGVNLINERFTTLVYHLALKKL